MHPERKEPTSAAVEPMSLRTARRVWRAATTTTLINQCQTRTFVSVYAGTLWMSVEKGVQMLVEIRKRSLKCQTTLRKSSVCAKTNMYLSIRSVSVSLTLLGQSALLSAVFTSSSRMAGVPAKTDLSRRAVNASSRRV